MNNSIASTIIEQLATLPDDLQRQVLEFAQALKSSVRKGIAGKNLLRFTGFIPSDDLKKMQQAIEAGCEQVDANEW
ncbi:MAG: hypothetical protein Q7U34_06650 [Anaerolineales bacterium]|nr:hypothetical protein [Anaerolineales bacterium]